MSFFEAIEIDKTFAGYKALDKVSIHVPRESIYGLLGPNGAGKTTLIRIINKITAPDKGRIILNGKEFKQEDIHLVGYLPEERGLYKKMRVGEQALYLARLKGLSRQEALKKLKYWFSKFEIESWWNKKIEELSKGMAQKIQFIITVLHEPELLIFDEPFSGFDPVNANMLKNEVLALKEKGTTIILSTHDMASVEELCDTITLLDKGKAVLEGKVSDIRHQFKNNIYELIYTGNPQQLQQSIEPHFEITEQLQLENNQSKVVVKLVNKEDGNALLKRSVDVVNIHSFKEILPGMNEVFIKAVSSAT